MNEFIFGVVVGFILSILTYAILVGVEIYRAEKEQQEYENEWKRDYD